MLVTKKESYSKKNYKNLSKNINFQRLILQQKGILFIQQ